MFDEIERIGEEVIVAYFKVTPMIVCRVPPEHRFTAILVHGFI
jgi:hypothetical protein